LCVACVCCVCLVRCVYVCYVSVVLCVCVVWYAHTECFSYMHGVLVCTTAWFVLSVSYVYGVYCIYCMCRLSVAEGVMCCVCIDDSFANDVSRPLRGFHYHTHSRVHSHHESPRKKSHTNIPNSISSLTFNIECIKPIVPQAFPS